MSGAGPPAVALNPRQPKSSSQAQNSFERCGLETEAANRPVPSRPSRRRPAPLAASACACSGLETSPPDLQQILDDPYSLFLERLPEATSTHAARITTHREPIGRTIFCASPDQTMSEHPLAQANTVVQKQQCAPSSETVEPALLSRLVPLPRS